LAHVEAARIAVKLRAVTARREATLREESMLGDQRRCVGKRRCVCVGKVGRGGIEGMEAAEKEQWLLLDKTGKF
jgi:hypothetical protein